MDGTFLSGKMLIAMPRIGDPRFDKSLILLCAHNDEHAMGVSVNQPIAGLNVPGLLKQLDMKGADEARPRAVLLGGPVETGRGFVLHTDDYGSEHSIAVPGGLALTTTRDALEALVADNGLPGRAILTLGYAGWGAGQLEREIRENVWLTVDADEALVFDEAYDTKWARALAKLGVDPGFLSAEAGQA